MATEILDIVVRQKGARVVARDVAKIGVSANTSAAALKSLQRQMQLTARGLGTLATGAKTAGATLRGVGAAAAGASAAMRATGLGAAVVGAAIVRGIGGALSNIVTTAGEFEAAMNLTGVLFQVDRTSDKFIELQDTAKELGRTTQFTARQAAEGLQFLAKAGFDANEAMEAIPETLKIAAVGAIDLGKASDITTNILRGFGLGVDDLAPAVDVLAATVSSTNVDILQLAESFKKVAPVAKQFGQGFTDIAAVVGALGDAGIKADESGTALRRIFINLQKDVLKTNSVLNRAGVAIRDTAGNMRPLIEIFKDISGAVISPGEKIDLFAARALAAAGIIDDSSKSLRGFVETLNDSVGRALEIQEARLVGFVGSTVLLKSAFEALQIAIAESGLLGFLTNAVDLLTGFTRAISLLPKPILAVIAALASLVLVGGAVLLQFGLLKLLITTIGFETFGAAALAALAKLKLMSAFFLTNPFGLLITALALATVAFITFKDEAFKVGEVSVTAAGVASQAWEELKLAVVTGLDTSTRAIKEFAVTGSAEISVFQTDVDSLTFSNFIRSIAFATLAGVKLIVEFAKRVKAALANLFEDIANFQGALVKAIVVGIQTGSIDEAGKAFGDNFTTSVLNSFDGLGENINQILIDSAGTVSDFEEAISGTEFVRRAAQRSGLNKPEKPGGTNVVGDPPDPNATPGVIPLAAKVIADRTTALAGLLEALSPVAAATAEFAEAQTILNDAQEANLITQQAQVVLLDAVASEGYQKLLAQIDPVVALQREESALLAEIAARAIPAGIGIEELARVTALVKDNTIEANRNLKSWQEDLKGTAPFTEGAAAAFQQFTDSLGNDFTIIRDGLSGAFQIGSDALTEFLTTGEFSFRQFATNVIGQIQQIITQLLILKLVKSLAGEGGGGGGIVGAISGAAHGATVQPGGQGSPFIVGERGPELFVPSTAGKIVPNGAGGGAAPVVNVQVVNVDDPKSVTDALNTREGEKVVMNIITRNAGALREIVG